MVNGGENLEPDAIIFVNHERNGAETEEMIPRNLPSSSTNLQRNIFYQCTIIIRNILENDNTRLKDNRILSSLHRSN